MENLSQIKWMLGAALRESNRNLLPRTRPLILDVSNDFIELLWARQEPCDLMQSCHQIYGKIYTLLPVICTFEHLFGPQKKLLSKIGINDNQTILTCEKLDVMPTS